ncbi:hypothetical protein D8M09_11350 [Enterobacter sp. R1(2018)]|nr:hypothetical protein D8M09_11350 [Enterobacter sp. R1(2018)]
MSVRDRILQEACFIHKRFNTAFTINSPYKKYLFHGGCTCSRFSRLHLVKVLTMSVNSPRLQIISQIAFLF